MAADSVTALFRNGGEWMVQFESGLRFRRPRTEFAGQESVTLAPAVAHAHAGHPAHVPHPV